MEDILGIPVEIGDHVVYTSGGRSEYELEIGEVVKFDENNKMCILRNIQTKRTQGRWRDNKEILNISIIKNYHPEYFI